MSCCGEEKKITLLEVPLYSSKSHRAKNASLLEVEVESKLHMNSFPLLSSQGLIKEESNEDDDEEEEEEKMEYVANEEGPKSRPKYSMTGKEQISSQLGLLDKHAVEQQLREFSRGNSFDVKSKKSKGMNSEYESTNSILNQAMIGSSNLIKPDGKSLRSQNGSIQSGVSLVQARELGGIKNHE